MSGVAVAVVGTSVVTTAVNANASRKAANQQADVAREAQSSTDEQYWQSRADLEPFRRIELQGANIGLDSMKRLQSKVNAGPGNFKASEGYKWTLGEGIKSLDKSAVAGGRSRNADTMKYAEGLASTEYDNFMKRYYDNLTPLQSLARVQTGATSQQVGANQTYANQTSNNLTNIGTANATGTINQANSWTSGVNNALNNYMAWKYAKG